MSLANGADLTRGPLLARNIGLNVAGGALPAIAAIAAVPPLVRAMGDARFGLLTLAWTTLGYFSLFDLGLGRALTQAVANRLGGDRRREIGEVVWTSLAVIVPFAFAGAALLYFGAAWITDRFLDMPGELQSEARTAFRVLALAIPFTAVAAVLRGLLESLQRFGWVNALRTPYGVLTFLGPVLVLPFSTSLVPAVWVITGGRIALAIAYAIVCLRIEPAVRRPRASRTMAASLLTFGGWMTVSNLVSPLMNTFDRYVVGAVLTVQTVAYYATPHELVTKMWLFTAAILPVFFPAFATSAANDPARTSHLFDRSLRVTFAVLFLPTLLLVLFAHDILSVWAGAAFAEQGALVMQILAVAVFVNTIGQAALTLIQSLGRPDLTGKFHLAELPLYAALLWYLLPRYGIVGVAIAWAARTIIDAMLLVATSKVVLPQSSHAVGRVARWLTAATVGITAAAFVPGTTARLALAAILVPAWAIVTWRGILTPGERLAPARMLGVARPD